MPNYFTESAYEFISPFTLTEYGALLRMINMMGYQLNIEWVDSGFENAASGNSSFNLIPVSYRLILLYTGLLITKI